MLIVKKFGGSSVADKERIFNVARRCAEEYQMGNDVIVVLSAMGDTTDELLEKAAEINPYPSKRELDMLLTTGICGTDGNGTSVFECSGNLAECIPGKDAFYGAERKCKI